MALGVILDILKYGFIYFSGMCINICSAGFFSFKQFIKIFSLHLRHTFLVCFDQNGKRRDPKPKSILSF